MEFKPKQVICKLNTDRFKYTCKNIHLDSAEHEVNNTYRFNKGVPYLVKNQEDYDELVSLDMFEVCEEVKEEPVSVETDKEKKKREKAEEKERKKIQKEAEEAEKLEAEESNEVEEDNSEEENPEEVE